MSWYDSVLVASKLGALEMTDKQSLLIDTLHHCHSLVLCTISPLGDNYLQDWHRPVHCHGGLRNKRQDFAFIVLWYLYLKRHERLPLIPLQGILSQFSRSPPATIPISTSSLLPADAFLVIDVRLNQLHWMWEHSHKTIGMFISYTEETNQETHSKLSFHRHPHSVLWGSFIYVFVQTPSHRLLVVLT